MKDHTSSAGQVENRRLAAIMFTDIVGFSRQMGSNEARTLRLLDTHNRIIQQTVAEHHGTVIKTVGDAFLVDFPSVVHAVQCAQQIQAQFRTHNAEKESAEQIHVRVGIHLGDIVQRDGDVFGDGVNIAARLQGLAEPDTICLSQAVYKEIVQKLPMGTVVSLGRPKLKNIAQREPVYALLPEPPKGFRRRLQVQRLKLKPWRRTVQAVAAVLVLVGAGVLGRYLSGATPAGLPLPDKPSIVVLPFVNMSEDPKQEYFSDGITEDLTTDFSKVSGLFVIARNSAFTYKGKAVKVQEVSKELGVRYVMEGSVRKMESQVRITAQLVDALTGQHLWAERYDRPVADLFALQEEIRQKITLALRVKLTPEEQERFKRAPTDNLEAYDYFLRGVEQVNRSTKEANSQARQLFEKALGLDAEYAGAYAALAGTHWLDWLIQWSPDPPQSLERAFALAQRAVALEDSLPYAHTVLGQTHLWKRHHEQAIAEAERAIALDPNYAEAYTLMAGILIFAGRPQESIELVEKAMRLNPHYPALYLNTLGVAHCNAGRYEEAIATQKRALARNPQFWGPHFCLAACYGHLGRDAEAQAEAAEVVRLNPNFSLGVFQRSMPYKEGAAPAHMGDAQRRVWPK
jgi:TolB-like protein/class 3 adenylate cyclase